MSTGVRDIKKILKIIAFSIFFIFIVVYAFIDHDIAYNITYMGAAERYPSDKPLIGGLVTSIKTYF